MNILNEKELEVIEKNRDIFTKDCDLRKVFSECGRGCYVGNILLATAYVCGYPFFVRYYTLRTGKPKVDLTCDTPYGEYRIASTGVDSFIVRPDFTDWENAFGGLTYYFMDISPDDLKEILRGATLLKERGRYLRDSL